ncbi:trehalose-6-phosphate synthase [Corynebacterium choanae]|uniref:alpha,alpha-trehalose-phosphate synthase (ADP-forming) n=1 Tax=Corynebacterium choanae TaxID=1862358 RepID=A0A3G6J4A6_9CORY|nr:trehalose-6-phosphate synthase [Corynebacterium choanae]AZA12776.1 Trehalose-phosphate synthase [Corynebacterium choanae]
MDSCAPAGFVVVANRLPVDSTIAADGTITTTTSPGGLVTALKPVLARTKGHWVGWSGLVDLPAGAEQPQRTEDGLSLVPVSLTSSDYAEFYEGMANATLWPLYHDRVVAPEFHPHWYARYAQVNQAFADAAVKVTAPGGTIWVQDYQLQLVPGMIKQQRPDVRVGFFCHIPFPGPDLFGQLPWRESILAGLVASDVLGFQIVHCAENFLATVARFLPAATIVRTAAGNRGVQAEIHLPNGHVCVVGAFPISIDVAQVREVAATTDPMQLRATLGDPAIVLAGVDRLDYTKGILTRLAAIEQLLQQQVFDPATMTFVQIATPSRERIEEYQRTRELVEQAVGRINGTYARLGRPVIHYHHTTYAAPALYELYAATDIMVVNAMKDGMNLVAKEYVTCRNGRPGQLVLSEAAGAAQELRQARLINPHDEQELAAAIAAAITTVQHHPDSAVADLATMAAHIAQYDVQYWADEFLACLRP